MKLPESGLAIIDCENERIVTTISAQKLASGKMKLPQRILLARKNKKKWQHIVLRSNEFVCSLKSFKDAIAMVAKDDDSNFFLW
ncbi:hypothetical protein C5957_03045 [Cronobacter sakazakii]|nr:hypothetical protein C5957_03045 [Cronobacter sakazakii]